MENKRAIQTQPERLHLYPETLRKHSIFPEKEIEVILEIRKFKDENKKQNSKRGMYANVAKQMKLYYNKKNH
jgi:hypothetical protein